MPDLYEFSVIGPIGPLIRSCLPGLTATTAGEATVLTGTARTPDDLQRVLDRLDSHGLTPVDIRLTSRPTATPPR